MAVEVEIIVIIVALMAGVIGLRLWRRHRLLTVYEWQWALIYRKGAFRKIAEPGQHHIFRPPSDWIVFDKRPQTFVMAGQEVLTKDALGLKVSAVVQYRIADPQKLVLAVPAQNEQQLPLHLHPILQIPIRAAIANQTMDELISNRDGISETIKGSLTPILADRGLELISANIRDIMLAREIREAYAANVLAQKQGQALLERARSEQAALRSLANSARMLRDNPDLMKLRVLQAMQSPDAAKHTFVLGLDGSAPATGQHAPPSDGSD